MAPSRKPNSGGVRLTDAQKLDWLRLYRSENIGPRTFQNLINRFGGASAALEALPDMLHMKGRAVSICSVAEAERELEMAARLNARFVALGEPDYPQTLAEIDAGPPLIAVMGRMEALQSPFVAIVGSRNASAAGLKMSEKLAAGLNHAGFAICSGLARGIDTRAHLTALNFGTVAVLAGGLDRPYPPENLKLMQDILERGAVISEMPLGWEPRGRDFPRRNRIISGLALGTVIVEAARKSGSLITARFALEQGREVFAVPGSPLDPRADGSNDLIREGATLVLGPQDIVSVLAPMLEAGRIPRDQTFVKEDSEPQNRVEPGIDEALWDELDLPGIRAAPQINIPNTISGHDAFEEPPQSAIAGLPMHPAHPDTSLRDRQACETSLAAPRLGDIDARSRLISVLGPSPIELDDLIRASGLPLSDGLSILLDLELEGRIERHGGNRVSLLE